MDANTTYYTMTFFGDSVKTAADLESFCQSMQYQYPDTFVIVNTNMACDGGKMYILLIYMC